MQTVNIHQAKTQLSKLVDMASKGEPFIIARAGKPLVKVVPLEEDAKKPPRRLDFLKGRSGVTVDHKAAFKDEIESMFYGDE